MLQTLLALLLAITPPIGKVVQCQGPANHNGMIARNGALVKAGDRINTPANAHVVIALAGGGALRIYPRSQVVINHSARVSLLSGRLLSAFRGHGGYRVQSPRLTAAVTGTVFYVEETPQLGGYICTCSGSVDVESATHPGQVKPLGAPRQGRHSAISVVGTRYQNMPLLGHTDSEVDEVLAIAQQESTTE